MSVHPPAELADESQPRQARPLYLLGVRLMLLGGIVAFGALFVQWSHLCLGSPTYGCVSMAPYSDQPYIPLQPGQPISLPQFVILLLPGPVLGIVISLLLLALRDKWRPVKLLILAFALVVSACGSLTTYAVGMRMLGFTDSDVHAQMDIGAYLSFLGYALVLLGVVLAIIGTSWRKQ